MIVADATDETDAVLIVKLADNFPERIVTDFGTVTPARLHERSTTIPPGAAAPLRVTVPAVVKPPVMLDGLTLTETRTAGVIVRVVVAATTPNFAVIVETFSLETPVVLTANEAVACPAGTKTEPGTDAALMLLDR